jgi:hypothetical protein
VTTADKVVNSADICLERRISQKLGGKVENAADNLPETADKIMTALSEQQALLE